MEKVTQTIKMKAGATLTVTQPFKQLNVIKGANVLTDIDAADIDKIRCELQVAGETGARKVTADSGKKNHYALSGGNVVFTIKSLPKGISTLVFRCYLANVYLDSRIDIVCDEAEAATTITMQTISLKAAEKDEAGIHAAVLYDRPQELTDDEKSQAKANIGLEGEVGATAVSYETQILNDEQKQQARRNIDAAGAAEVAAALEQKANIDGYYSQLTAGAAENLVGGNDVSREFTRDTAGGTADIADGIVQIDRIKGNTIVFNQKHFYFNSLSTENEPVDGSRIVKLNDYSLQVIVEQGAVVTKRDVQLRQITTDWLNHYYYISFFDKQVSGLGFKSNNDDLNAPRCEGTPVIIKANRTGEQIYTLTIPNNLPAGVYTAKFVLIDLTRMFGAGNEPATVAEFKKMFPLDYYNYNAGQLLNLNPTGILTDGFNQYNHANPVIKVFPQQYYIGGTYTSVWFSKNADDEEGSEITPVNHLFTPSGYGYIHVEGGNATDTVVNLHWSGKRDGEYEPYWQSTRNLPIAQINTDGTITESTTGKTRLFPDGLCSAGSVYDEVTSTKAIKRIGKIDLGSLDWLYGPVSSTYPFGYFSSHITDIIFKYSGSAITTKYISLNASFGKDKSVSLGTNNHLYIIDSSYTEAAAFKAAMSGVYLYCELAEPIEVEFSEPLNLTYRVSDFGTETLLPINTEAPVTTPIRLDVVYGLNVVDFVRNADKNYLTIEDSTGDNGSSFTNLRSALSTAFGIDIVPSYDSTNKRYTFAITDNRKVEVPASATASGLKGTWAEDETAVYFCTDTDTWVKISKTAWE